MQSPLEPINNFSTIEKDFHTESPKKGSSLRFFSNIASIKKYWEYMKSKELEIDPYIAS